MKHWKKKFLATFLAAVMMFSLAGCETYDEWEARTASEKAQQESLQASAGDNQAQTESTYTGPNLADYFNSGIEEAKENGLYTETDYSSIFGGSQGPVSGTVTETDSSSGADPSVGSEYNNNGTGMESGDDSWTGLLNYLSMTEYEGEPFIYVDNNIPYFTKEEMELTNAFESYSELDELGRVQYAFASIDESLMPEDGEERGDISSVKPTGWMQAQYDGIDNGGWLYNRSHLIAWSLTGENDNEKNLMTGTRYFNVEAMLPCEIQVLEYLDENPENHVLYRATPVYYEDDLLAKGLLLEAYSIEDDGELSFCVFLYNVQPDITINYQTGESSIGE